MRMKNIAKLTVISVFALGALFMFLSSNGLSRIGAAAFSNVAIQPTPPKNTNIKPANANAGNTTPTVTTTTTTTVTTTVVNTGAANTVTNTSTVPTSGGGKSIPKTFTLAKDSQSENGEVAFNHDAHAFMKYSPDGSKVMGCVECHHTDQPKSALKPPDVTSERNETLTLEVFQKSTQEVSECRACHFQDGSVPEGKIMPTAGGKDMNNQLAFHINCNTCHDAAFKARPELKTHKGFATSKDCAVCHKTS